MTNHRSSRRRGALIAGLGSAGLLIVGVAQAQDGPPAPPPAPASAEAAEVEPEVAPRSRSGPPRARARVRPYLEVSQVLSADLNDGDVLTYTSVAAGVDGSVRTRRVAVQMSYRYERQIAWEGNQPDQSVHSGVAMANVQLVPGMLNFDAGALAARTGGYGRGPAVSTREPGAQVYSVYAGPTLSARAGPVAVNASYRLGYAHLDDDGLAGVPGQPRNRFDSSVTHTATASVGMAPGRLPIGWTVGGGYTRSESGELENRFEGRFVRGDIVAPLGPTVAVTAGVGYEDIQSSQMDVVRDGRGVPVVTADGRLVGDPSRPRLLAYDESGFIYDAGVIWRPGPRTELQARAGHRYGGTSVTGSLEHRFNPHYGVSAQVYDSVGTYSNVLINQISDLPDEFNIQRNPLTGGFDGCVFGRDPGSGVCFDQALQTISGATFRSRGASILFSGARGPWDFGLGAGYSHRRYFDPVSGDISTIDPRTDHGFTLNGSLGRQLSRSSEMGLSAYASWFDSDRTGFEPVFGTGVTASYSRRFMMDRMRLFTAVGVNHSQTNNFDSTAASGLIGVRVGF